MTKITSPCAESPRLQFTKNMVKIAAKCAQTMRQEKNIDTFISAKGTHDFVTLADQVVEDSIRMAISQMYPNDNILGEESGWCTHNMDADAGCWIIDPIDGTNNYMRGTPDWAIIITFVQGGVIEMGVIYVPDQDILVWAEQGKGAYINGVPVALTTTDDPQESMAHIGYNHKKPYTYHMQLLDTIFTNGYEYRRLGCAGVSCVRLAQGCAELYYEGHINAWDILAGILIMTEAGGYAHHPPIKDLMIVPAPVFISNGKVDPTPFIQLTNIIADKS